MIIEISLAWICAVLLCAVRLSLVMLLTPVLGAYTLPGKLKGLFLLGMSAALVSGMPGAVAALPARGIGMGDMLFAIVAELATGALLAFGVHTAFGAVAFAGKLLDVQIGFGLGNIYDPITRRQAPLLASVLGVVAVVMFFSMDMHHVLLKGLAYSFEKLPLGRMLGDWDPQLLVRQFGTVFTLGLMMGAPLVFCLFLVDIGLGVLSRNLPQMNMFVVGIPVKILGGLVLLTLMVRSFEPVFSRVFASAFTFWDAVLR